MSSSESLYVREEEIYYRRLESLLEDELGLDVGEKVVGVSYPQKPGNSYVKFKIAGVGVDEE